jgi:hypothetical protein
LDTTENPLWMTGESKIWKTNFTFLGIWTKIKWPCQSEDRVIILYELTKLYAWNSNRWHPDSPRHRKIIIVIEY